MKALAKSSPVSLRVSIVVMAIGYIVGGITLGLYIFMYNLNDGSIESGGIIMLPIAIICFILAMFSTFTLISIKRRDNTAMYISDDAIFIVKKIKPSINPLPQITTERFTLDKTIRPSTTERFNPAIYDYNESLIKINLSDITKVSGELFKQPMAGFWTGFLFGTIGFALVSSLKIAIKPINAIMITTKSSVITVNNINEFRSIVNNIITAVRAKNPNNLMNINRAY